MVAKIPCLCFLEGGVGKGKMLAGSRCGLIVSMDRSILYSSLLLQRDFIFKHAYLNVMLVNIPLG